MLEQPKSNDDYQAEWDAQSLAEAEKIKGDPARLEKAQTAAVRLAEEEREKANAMRKVAGRKRSSGAGSGGSKKTSGKAMPGNYNVFQKI